MEFEIIEKPGFKIMGLAIWTINKDSLAKDDIYDLWQRWFKEDVWEQIPGRLSDNIYNMYCDYESDYSGRYKVILGNEVSSIDYVPPGLEGKKIPKSRYAVYHLKGKLPEIVYKTWESIYRETSYERKYSADFDIYSPDAFDPINSKVLTCVSIK